MGTCARPEGSGVSTGTVWTVAFLYAATAALLVQLVVLPHLYPGWHAGSGLLIGGDWLEFHGHAVQQAARIRAEGWRAFELRPHSHAPAGVASILYALTWPEPWVLIPLNAALHATAAALLFRLLRGFVQDWRWAAGGTAPFVVYPTALTWVTQIHKDGFFIAGYYCLFAAWAQLARWEPAAEGRRGVRGAIPLLLAGFGLIWLVRPDLVVVAQAAAGLALVTLTLRLVARIRHDPRHWQRAAAMLALVALTTSVAAWLTHAPLRFVGSRRAPVASHADARAYGQTLDPVPIWEGPARGVGAIPWYQSAWLPAAMDRLAYRMALTREVFLVNYITGQSNLDLDVGFYRATDVARYLPRAIQIGLLAPFPTDWRAAGSLEWTTLGRRIVVGEMLGIYAGLLGLAVATARRWRGRADLWIVVLPCLAILTLYSLVVPNLGALHRFRYGFLMLLVGLGIAGGLDLLRRRAATAPERRAGAAGRFPRDAASSRLTPASGE
jgi:hypothetical protein